ncbi:hypothetical protein NAF17_11265 [Mucilaginibacter sp. RB4R14]|uniref:hypothetical protein n=1 Tax=Mucilaginibacter aurantiaciroseus TaxID=2949308 RepID=UPI002091D73B|nr:hypothetical protein [Mucilaginibacter aurantiaciroseus]MCO5936118.1 hypothetical protein [Mucilaginibacter aurantiaciroseus]
MKTNVRKMLAIVALTLPVLFTACKKDNEAVPESVNAVTNVKFTFSSNAASPKSADGKAVDLSNATTLKVVYGVKDNGITLPVLKEAELILSSTVAKATTIDQKVFTFKAGTTLTIRSAVLLNAEGKIIATAPADEFKVSSPQGTMIMERKYDVTGIERN